VRAGRVGGRRASGHPAWVEFRARVHEALAHLHDAPALETHALAALAWVEDRGGSLTPGQALRRSLLEAADALGTASGGSGAPGADRAHRLLVRRYLDAEPIAVVRRELAVGRSEYFREHARAVDAVAEALRERWALTAPGGPPGPHPLAGRGPTVELPPLAELPALAELAPGTLTYLFTDLEGWVERESPVEATRAALLRHDALVGGAVLAHGGRVLDASRGRVRAAFLAPQQGLRAAVAAQRALLAEPWPTVAPLRARMALHTGRGEPWGGDYAGPAVDHAAQLATAGHGGQLLVSAVTSERLRDGLPPGVGLRDLGEARLSDLHRPQRVFQVVLPDLPVAFPPLRTLDSVPNNLPLQVTSFVGRAADVAEVRRLLGATRLLTLTGTGGVGKTRLALRVAVELLAEQPDGIWFVDLGRLIDPALVDQTLAAAMGLRLMAGRSIEQAVRDHAGSKRLLVLLDGCEHLIVPCARLADTLIRALPGVQVLATSREPLGIAGELSWRVPSLPVPDSAPPLPMVELGSFAAVRLFVERAAAVVPGFALTDKNAPAIARICRRLDGIPLAIELAAARVRVLTADQIAVRLDEAFGQWDAPAGGGHLRLLTGGSRTALRRQQTLEALVDWSHDLLDEGEQVLFRRLAAFGGGWTLEAAEAVGAAPPLSSAAVLDLLTGLVDKSMVVAEAEGDSERYRFLDTIRHYAQLRLRAAGAEADETRDRHAAYYLESTPMTGTSRAPSPSTAWLERAVREQDNLRAALSWLVARGRAEDALRMGARLFSYWYNRGHLVEGLASLRRVLAMPGADAPTAERSLVLWCAAMVARNGAGELEAARAYSEEGLAIARALGDQLEEAAHLASFGLVARELGDDLAHRAMAEEALRISVALGRGRLEAVTRHQLAQAVLSLGDPDGARRLHEEGLAICRAAGDDWGVGRSLAYLGALAVEQGDLDGGRARLAECLAVMEDVRTPQVVAIALEGFAALAARTGRHARALRLRGAAAALREASGNAMVRTDLERQERWLTAARQRLGASRAAAAEAEGRKMTLARAIAEALDDAESPAG
jgi:predicted ATPase